MDRAALVTFLDATPGRLRDLVGRIPAGRLRQPATDGWTPLQILGHLKDSIVINEGRFQRIVHEDNPRIVRWNQDETAANSNYNSQESVEFLEQIAASRARMVVLLRSLDDEQWRRAGQHEDPEWGAITIEWLANHLREHETEHLAEIQRVADKGAS